MSRYTKEHYEDVARILSQRRAPDPGEGLGRIRNTALTDVANDFADLFAADPRYCIHCGDEASTTAVCPLHDEHLFEGGFDRARFLAACGLEAERDTGWPDGECPTCGHTDDHTLAQCEVNLAAHEAYQASREVPPQERK